MKSCLCLSGFMGCFRLGLDHMRKQFDGDVFLATWDKDADAVVLQKGYNLKGLEIVSFEPVSEALKAKCEYFKKYRDYDAKWHKNREGWDSLCMLYLLKRVGLLKREYEIRNGFRYDTVIKSRPDHVYRGLFPFEKQSDVLYFPENANFSGVTDNLVCGDSMTMDKFFLLPDLVDTYLLADKTVWIHEHLVAQHIVNHNLKIGKVKGWTYRCADGTPPGGDQPEVGW